MAGPYRRHAVVEAPVAAVWAVLSDPRTHPDWWPEVTAVELEGPLAEGGGYVRTSRRFGMLGQVDAVWVAERLEDLKEAHYRCTVSGTYARFALTPVQDETFVEIETGMLPPNLRWRLAQTLSRGYFHRWLRDVVAALPTVVAQGRGSGQQST